MARTYRLGPARRLVNRIVGAGLRVGIGPQATYLMTTTGRRTGLERTTPVTLVDDGQRRWLVAPYGSVPWVHNVRAGSTVGLRRGRRRERTGATEVDAVTAGPVLRSYAAAVAVARPYFDAGKDDPVEAFAAEAARHPVFELVPLGPTPPVTTAAST